jgi:hypothetical protein
LSSSSAGVEAANEAGRSHSAVVARVRGRRKFGAKLLPEGTLSSSSAGVEAANEAGRSHSAVVARVRGRRKFPFRLQSACIALTSSVSPR